MSNLCCLIFFPLSSWSHHILLHVMSVLNCLWSRPLLQLWYYKDIRMDLLILQLSLIFIYIQHLMFMMKSSVVYTSTVQFQYYWNEKYHIVDWVHGKWCIIRVSRGLKSDCGSDRILLLGWQSLGLWMSKYSSYQLLVFFSEAGYVKSNISGEQQSSGTRYVVSFSYKGQWLPRGAWHRNVLDGGH